MYEKRKKPRHNAIARVIIENDDFKGTYYTRNISAGGMFIATDDDLMKLKSFRVTLCFKKANPITLNAKAVHNYPPRHCPEIKGYGIMFADVSKEMGMKIHECIDMILQEEEQKPDIRSHQDE